MSDLQTAVEATDECRRSFEQWYVKDYGEKEYYKSNTKAQVWVAFQAAWDARQPEVVGFSREQMVDALRHFIGPFRSIDIEYYLNSLTPAAEVPIPTVEEIADHIDLWFRSGEDKPWSFIVEDLAGSIHALLTKGRGGV